MSATKTQTTKNRISAETTETTTTRRRFQIQPQSSELPHRERFTRLDANESTRPPSPAAAAAVAQLMRHTAHWYADPHARDLRRSLATYTGADEDAIRVFAGTSDAVITIVRAFLSAGRELTGVTPLPDTIRRSTEATNGTVRPVMVPDVWSAAPGALLAAMTPQTRLVYLPMLHPLTGTTLTAEQVAALLWTCPEIVFIVDESYHEYTQSTTSSLIKAHDNLIVLRTFDHAFGLAGLPVAYTLTSPALAETLDSLRNPGAVATASLCAAEAVLADFEYRRATVAQARLAQTELAASLVEMGLTVRRTEANFLFVQVRQPAALTRLLANRMIFVANLDTIAGCEGYLRITVGDLSTTERVIAAFRAAPVEYLWEAPSLQLLRLKRPAERPSVAGELH